MNNQLQDYDFQLPDELVAQAPSPDRSQARLLVVRRNPGPGEKRFEDLLVSELPQLIQESPALQKSRWFRNRSKVFPARFYGHRESGSRHEIVLLEPVADNESQWKAIIRNSRRFHYPEKIKIEGSPTQEFIMVSSEGIVDLASLGPDPLERLEDFGEMPLPPYIQKRDPIRDRQRYQSLWSENQHRGSAAAPTASLHFDQKLIEILSSQISFMDLVLHVGLGTFEPLRSNTISENKLHSERIRVPERSAVALDAARPPLNVAVGTTALRTMESFKLFQRSSPDVELRKTENGEWIGRSRIFIREGYEFLATDALLTNFHLPKSSLFILLSTFAGSPSLAKEAYHHAIAKKYRFFSYGDASFWI